MPKTFPKRSKYLRAKQNAERLHGAAHAVTDEQSHLHVVSNTMQKTKIKSRFGTKSAKKSSSGQSSKSDQTIQALEKKIVQMGQTITKMAAPDRDIQLSGLGRLAFDAGNSISQFFGGGKIFGSGAYKLNKNNMWDTANQVPRMHSNSDSIILSHCEYIGEISTSVGFTMQQSYLINPGLATSFPFLSSIANSFSEYRFKGLVYEFKSTSGTAVGTANTALGAVMLCAQYRADAPAPTSKLEMLNEMWSVDSKPSLNAFLPIECDPDENPLSLQYIRSGNQPVGDTKFYDLGKVFIATQGSQNVNIAGELWVTYEVELKKPVLANFNGPYSGNSYTFEGTGVLTAIPTGIPFRESIYGLPIVRTQPGAGTDTFTFPKNIAGSRYLCVVYANAGTSVSIAAFNVTGGSAIASWGNDSLTTVQGGNGTTTQVFSAVVECTTDGQMTIDYGCVYTGTAYMALRVCQVSEDAN